MPRPVKITEPTKLYNLLIKQNQYDKLANIASNMQKKSLEQIAVADLIRDAIDAYISVIEEEEIE
jgi:hypothetical protein